MIVDKVSKTANDILFNAKQFGIAEYLLERSHVFSLVNNKVFLFYEFCD